MDFFSALKQLAEILPIDGATHIKIKYFCAKQRLFTALKAFYNTKHLMWMLPQSVTLCKYMKTSLIQACNIFGYFLTNDIFNALIMPNAYFYWCQTHSAVSVVKCVCKVDTNKLSTELIFFLIRSVPSFRKYFN